MFVSDPVFDTLLRGLILTPIGMTWVVVLVRINGLRSFSKMTNFDFVMTVAMGSALATAGTASSWTGFAQALAVMASLVGVQFLTALTRKRVDGFERIMQNKPVVLMRDGEVDHQALAETRVAYDDLIAKLREANVLNFGDVRAVVLETTGDVTVLHGDGPLHDDLMQNTRRAG
ncbi:MAG: YetF domain-containing protein [Pacificimonas sp.]|jgi:uncharacterized membrane protein YcaP (DUF421 family)|nr:YetF domain-containing protein [Pacificimonas sp.]